MPIHLAPISRRRFLRQSALASALLALKPTLWASSRRTDTHGYALLSDTHLAANRGLLARGINMTDHFTQVGRELLGAPRRPAGVFSTGDCAYNSGASGDYTVLSELLAPLRADGMPIHLALGNHDSRERFWEAFPNEKTARGVVEERQTSLVATPRANWFMLDSLEITQATPGLLGAAQLEWLTQALDRNRVKPALVLVHHNPGLDGGGDGLKDAAALLEILRPRRQAKGLIFGHTHRWKVEQDPSGLHLINLPAVAYVFQKGEPSGWVQATLERKAMRLELRSLDPAHPAHGQVLRLAWRR